MESKKRKKLNFEKRERSLELIVSVVICFIFILNFSSIRNFSDKKYVWIFLVKRKDFFFHPLHSISFEFGIIFLWRKFNLIESIPSTKKMIQTHTICVFGLCLIGKKYCNFCFCFYFSFFQGLLQAN